MQKLDRIFDSDDVSRTRRVNSIDHCRERRGLSRSSRAGHQNQPAALVGEEVDYRRPAKLHTVLAFIGNDAHHDADAAAPLKNVSAKSAQAFYAFDYASLRI